MAPMASQLTNPAAAPQVSRLDSHRGQLLMDTSTLSFTEDVPDSHRTLSSAPQRLEPAPWHTSRISPNTKLDTADTSSAVSAKGVKHRLQRLKMPDIKIQRFDWDSSAVPNGDAFPAIGGERTIEYGGPPNDGPSTVLIVFIPILVVILTVLLGVLIFLIALLCMKRQRGIRLAEDGGPLDLSKGDGVMGEGGTEGVESRWLETVDPDVKEAYLRAKDWQMQYPPASVPTDITLSQFLSIQEKGVAAWAFEPDYEENLSLYVQSRTEITFLSDGPGMPAREGGGNSVMANLPLPKINEVYYWEVKVYDKPATTEVAIGLATKPYPSFRLPGWNRFSVAYFASDGFRSHNYPFTASSYGPPLAEGDVLGVGYRPRTGTVFFTRNGRKLEDCYTGLQRLNLFPTVGANGPCTLHINLGQAGFVFIEANVKKWGLAPMNGTLAPPPPYGSDRGSILLDAGYGTPGQSSNSQPNHSGIAALLEAARNRAGSNSSSSRVARPIPVASPVPTTPRRHHRAPSSIPAAPSPLRDNDTAAQGEASGYRSPTDEPQVAPRVPLVDDIDSESESASRSEESEQSPPNPPTPNVLDISLHSLRGTQSYFARRPSPNAEEEGGSNSGRSGHSGESTATLQPPSLGRAPSYGPPEDSPPPPGYAPLDPHVYASGLPADLPEELINQAIAAMSDAETPAEQPTPSPEHEGGGPLRWLRSMRGD